MTDRTNVGLSGDGDEIAAVQEIEKEFGVTLDYSGAHGWSTVGDVYDALLKQLSSAEANNPNTWVRFATAICKETGIPPSSISRDSGMIAEDGMWVHVANASKFIWLVIVVGLAASLLWAA